MSAALRHLCRHRRPFSPRSMVFEARSAAMLCKSPERSHSSLHQLPTHTNMRETMQGSHTSRLVLLLCSRLEMVVFGENEGRRIQNLPPGPSVQALEVWTLC